MPDEHTSFKQFTDSAVNLALLAFLAFLAIQPDGPIRQTLDRWQDDRREAQLVDQHWQALTASTATLGGMVDTPVVNELRGRSTIVEFADYECPFCRNSHPILQDFIKSVEGVRIVYRHLPLTSIHPHAEAAARAAICAEQQGYFQSMHDWLYASDDWRQQDATWGQYAANIGVPDLDAFEYCLTSGEARERIARDKELADSMGITGTPTFIFRDGIHRGVVDLQDLEDMVGQ